MAAHVQILSADFEPLSGDNLGGLCLLHRVLDRYAPRRCCSDLSAGRCRFEDLEELIFEAGSFVRSLVLGGWSCQRYALGLDAAPLLVVFASPGFVCFASFLAG